MGHWLPLSQLPQEINDKSNTSQTSCGNCGWPTQTAAGSQSERWVMLSKQVMVRNLRRGQIFCLIPVTPCLWTTPGPGALPGKEMLLQGISRAARITRTPKPYRKAIFGTAWSQRSGRKRHQKVHMHSPSLLMGKTCSEVYLLYAARTESPGSTSSAVNQGIARLLLLAVHQLWSNCLLSGSELMAND